MRFKWRKFLVFFLLSILGFHYCFSQEQTNYFTDSTSLVEFLSTQNEISGIAYRIRFVSDKSIENRVPDSLIVISNEEYSISTSFKKLSEALEVKTELWLKDSVISEIEFSYYDQRASVQTILDHVNELISKNELNINPIERRDLITLAHKTPYLSSDNKGFGFFTDLKIIIITVIIIAFALVTLGMIVFMLIFKINQTKKERLSTEFDIAIVAPLSEIFFERSLKEIEEMTDEELHDYFPKNLMSNPLYKNVLIDRILALNKSMKGEFKIKLKAIYTRLHLDQVSVSYLSSKKWDRVVAGLVQINEMDLFETVPQVKKHVHSSNFHIHSQAVATLLNISSSVDLSFLRDQTFPLSRWQQMNYLRIIRFIHKKREIQLDSLFVSENQSIRLFSYKLVRILGMVGLVQDLVDKFEDVSDDEKIEMLQTFETLGIPVDSKIIECCLSSNNEKLILRAARAAGQIGDEKAEEMLWSFLPRAQSFLLKKTILTSLKILNKDRYIEFIALSTIPDYHRINKHLLDPILQDV